MDLMIFLPLETFFTLMMAALLIAATFARFVVLCPLCIRPIDDKQEADNASFRDKEPQH